MPTVYQGFVLSADYGAFFVSGEMVEIILISELIWISGLM